MPATNIASARIQLYTGVLHWSTCGSPWAADPVFNMRRVTGEWNEMTVNWPAQPTYDAATVATHTFTGVAGLASVSAYRWVSYDITALYQNWASGAVPNYGVRISHDNPFCLNCVAAFFSSSDDGHTSLKYSGPTQGNYAASTTLSATLLEGTTGVAGRTVAFTLGTQGCSAVTDAKGVASCAVTPAGAGTQSITIVFAGDARYQPSSVASTFTVIGTGPAVVGTVIEFYNTNLDNYFITADANEAAAIDNGSAGPGWSRTGGTFNSGGPTAVCRFYGSITPGPNSHFYTADAAECATLKQIQAATPATQKRWNFESLDFLTSAPASGTCPAGTTAVYRAYNNGFARGVDSNHRITSSQAGIQQVVARGWTNEGLVMCAPL